MPDLVISIPDDKYVDFVETMAEFFDYPHYLETAPNPVGSQLYVKRSIIRWIRDAYRKQKRQNAIDAIADETIDLT